MVTRRSLLGGIGVGATGVAAYGLLSGCGSNLDDIDQGYVGSRATLKGELSIKLSDNSKIYISNGDLRASIAIQQQYRRHVDDTDIGDCISASAYITEVKDDRIKAEGGEIR